MEKENIKENQVNSEVEETEVQTSNIETTETGIETQESLGNNEVQELVNNEKVNKTSSVKIIFANILDQLLVLAGSAVLLLLIDVILKSFGYMFVKESGAIVLAGAIVYFVINCIYTPIMETSKIKNTIGKKILNTK